MNWQALWDYFGNFNNHNSHEGLRVFTILVFVFGIPVAIGLLAKTIVWSARQVVLCRNVLRGHDPEPPNETLQPTAPAPTVSGNILSQQAGPVA